jgi:ankyrin repeat protein
MAGPKSSVGLHLDVVSCYKILYYSTQYNKSLNFLERYIMNLYELASMCKAAYEANETTMPKSIGNWDHIRASELNNHAYQGVAYLNDTLKMVVIAHRGTDFNYVENIRSDASIAVGSAPQAQLQAYTFSSQVRKDMGTEYEFIESGHSLGAIHAEINALYFRSKAITFESPGSKPMAAQALVNQKVSAEDLELMDKNVTTYVASPNLVNTANEHVGKMIRVHVLHTDTDGHKVSRIAGMHALLKLVYGGSLAMVMQTAQIASEFFRYDFRLHSLENMMREIDRNLGIPFLQREVENWPAAEAYRKHRLSFVSASGISEYIDTRFRVQKDVIELNRRWERAPSQASINLKYGKFIFAQLDEVRDNQSLLGTQDIYTQHVLQNYHRKAVNKYSIFYVGGYHELLENNNLTKNSPGLQNLQKLCSEMDNAIAPCNSEDSVETVKELAKDLGSSLSKTQLDLWNNLKSFITNQHLNDNAFKQQFELMSKTLKRKRTVMFYQDQHGRTLLHHAALCGNVAAVNFLTEYYPELINTPCFKKETPLIVASKACISQIYRLQIIRYLVDRKAEVNAQDCLGKTALHHLSAELGSYNVLIGYAGADLTFRDLSGTSALWSSSNDEFALRLQYMMSTCIAICYSEVQQLNQEKPSSREYDKSTTLYLYNTVNVLKRMIWDHFKQAINQNVPNQLSQDILVLSEEAKLEILRCLNNGSSLLHYAANCKDREEIVKVLLEGGAHPNIRDEKRKTPMHIAVQNGYYRYVEILLSYGADVNAKDILGNSVLHYVPHSNFPLFKLLINNGALPYDFNFDNKSVMYAFTNRDFAYRIEGIIINSIAKLERDLAKLAHSGQIKLPLEDTVEYAVEQQSSTQQPYIHSAFTTVATLVRAHDLKIREEWLNYDVPTRKLLVSYIPKNSIGLMHIAASSGYTEALDLFIQDGADINVADYKDGMTPLHHACSVSNTAMVRHILDKKDVVRVSLQDKSGRTPLHMTRYDQYEIFNSLIASGADVKAINKGGESVFWVLSNADYAWRLDHILIATFNRLFTHISLIKDCQAIKYSEASNQAETSISKNLSGTPLSSSSLDVPVIEQSVVPEMKRLSIEIESGSQKVERS